MWPTVLSMHPIFHPTIVLHRNHNVGHVTSIFLLFSPPESKVATRTVLASAILRDARHGDRA